MNRKLWAICVMTSGLLIACAGWITYVLFYILVNGRMVAVEPNAWILHTEMAFFPLIVVTGIVTLVSLIKYVGKSK